MAATIAARSAARAVGKLTPESSVFFLCDMQERFRDSIFHFSAIANVCNRLTTAAEALEVPLVVTEQYPKALGHTVPEIKHDHAICNLSKTKFSMMVPELVEKLVEDPYKDRSDAVLFGIEGHVCVQQTALDLLEQGYNVHVIADAVSSRTSVNRLLALERMKQSGAFVTSCESILFQLMGDSKHPAFKAVQKLIIENAPDSKLLGRD
eukprot:TRINITY_DN6609_c0_g1_i1.p1 TRINITY_DN6609_c0_g1~~TRINITY_DN6609_c0_g1_i1.p1  ORF type:complete len:208 (+),score=28.54 TRINITY_DN6609_c0_g1_i1:53-676(+)